MTYRAIRRSTSGACAASTKNVARVRNASSRAHRSASSWCLSRHMPSRYICHLRAHRTLHSSGSASTTVRNMSPRSSAPHPPSLRWVTQGAPVSPRRERVSMDVGSTSWWCSKYPVECEGENGVGAAFTRAICSGDSCQCQGKQGGCENWRRTCHMPGRAAARKRHGDGAEAICGFSLSRSPDFIPETNAASWPQTTSPVCASRQSEIFGNRVRGMTR